MTAHCGAGAAALRELAAGDVTAFMTAESRRLAPKTVQRLATALRSPLRYWHLQGLTSGPLDQVVPRIPNRRPGLPQPLEQSQAAALLASCDLQTATGRRRRSRSRGAPRRSVQAERFTDHTALKGRHRREDLDGDIAQHCLSLAGTAVPVTVLPCSRGLRSLGG